MQASRAWPVTMTKKTLKRSQAGLDRAGARGLRFQLAQPQGAAVSPWAQQCTQAWPGDPASSTVQGAGGQALCVRGLCRSRGGARAALVGLALGAGPGPRHPPPQSPHC